MAVNPAILANIYNIIEAKICHQYPPWLCHGPYSITLFASIIVSFCLKIANFFVHITDKNARHAISNIRRKNILLSI
jgi:hypothetical protein